MFGLHSALTPRGAPPQLLSLLPSNAPSSLSGQSAEEEEEEDASVFTRGHRLDAGERTGTEEMLPLATQLGVLSALAAALTSVLSALLLLALTRQLWSLRWSLTRDKESSLPLPRGSMGWPLVGETFHWLFQVRADASGLP